MVEPSIGVWTLAGLFFILIPGLILLKTSPLLIKPPVMMRVDESGVTFGTLFAYKPYTIPLKYLERVGTVTIEATVSMPFALGMALYFKKDPSIPTALATSAGITFGFGRLYLRWVYMNRLPHKVVRDIKPWVEYAKGL